MIIKIGKAGDNDYVVDDAHVSRYHAQLKKEADGIWILEDLNSTNGTFVNGIQINKKTVIPNDKIILGDSYLLDFNEVLKHNNDYSEEFAKLQKVYSDYIEAKLKIQSSNIFKTRLFQSIPFSMIGVVGLAFGFLGNGSPLLLVISLSIAICAPVIGIYLGAKQSSKTPRMLQEAIDQFKTDYVCPKCGAFLGDIPWESLRNKKYCPVPTCKAKWCKD